MSVMALPRGLDNMANSSMLPHVRFQLSMKSGPIPSCHQDAGHQERQEEGKPEAAGSSAAGLGLHVSRRTNLPWATYTLTASV